MTQSLKGEGAQCQNTSCVCINIVAMRNRLIHVYFDIDLDRVWDTITDDLPALIILLEKLVHSEGNP